MGEIHDHGHVEIQVNKDRVRQDFQIHRRSQYNRPMTRRGVMRLAAAWAARIAVATPAQRQLVLMDQDGGMPDDYLSVALLLTMETVEALAVVVTPADCYLEPAVSATRKILALMGLSS